MGTSGNAGISPRAIREFTQRWPEAESPLHHWANVVESSNWSGSVRRSMNTADFVGDLVVFDIGGNKYRLIAFIRYRRQYVFIKNILTHKEYDKATWKR